MVRNVHTTKPCTSERNASHNSRRNVLLRELFTKANIMLISPGQEQPTPTAATQGGRDASNVDSLGEEMPRRRRRSMSEGMLSSCSSRKSKIYDDGIVVMQCASHRVATSHKFPLTTIFYLLFAFNVSLSS